MRASLHQGVNHDRQLPSRSAAPSNDTTPEAISFLGVGPLQSTKRVRIGVVCTLFAAIVFGWWAPALGADVDRAFINKAVRATAYIEVERVYHGYDFSNAGSGFFIHPDGFIMTNWHVIADQVEMVFMGEMRELSLTVVHINVIVDPGTPNERKLPAKVVGRDRDLDVALLKVNYRPAQWITPSDGVQLDLMDDVFVVGFPFGDLLTFNEQGGISLKGYPEPSINAGRVTSLRRDDKNRVVAVQTDAAINPGNSGGPMLDAKGRLAGVVYSGISGGTQIGFAIAPQRVYGFYLDRVLKVKFFPPYIPNPRSSVKITVEPGILALNASRISVRVDGAQCEAFDVDLEQAESAWEADINVPDKPEEITTKQYYTASLRVYDTRGRQSFQRKYRLAEVESAEVGLKSHRDPEAMMRDRILANSMSLGEYARKKAAEDAAENTSPGGSAPSAPASPPLPSTTTQQAELTVDPPESEMDISTNLTRYAKEMYREGRYQEAADVLERVVEKDPTDDVAREYLDMARDRLAMVSGNDSNSEVGETTSVEDIAPPETAEAQIDLLFESPLRVGQFNFWLDDEPLAAIDFSFKKKMFGKGGSTRVERSIEIDPGRRKLTVSLEDDDDRSLGLFSFEESFEAGTRWTLRVDMPSTDSKPQAFLIKRR